MLCLDSKLTMSVMYGNAKYRCRGNMAAVGIQGRQEWRHRGVMAGTSGG
jgi:hypothetical protein